MHFAHDEQLHTLIMAILPEERRECHDSALNCFGTAYIFETRASPLRIAGKLLAFSSFAGPIAIGAVVLSFGTKGEAMPSLIALAGVLSIGQVILSLWSLIARWSENLAYCIESKTDNYFLAGEFTSLGNSTALDDAKWHTQFEVLKTMGKFRQRHDLTHDISDEEKRMGMRAALRQYQRSCVYCTAAPATLESSSCPVCGNFKKRTLKWLT